MSLGLKGQEVHAGGIGPSPRLEARCRFAQNRSRRNTDESGDRRVDTRGRAGRVPARGILKFVLRGCAQ